jgi:Rrf2 family cysteine metabolism transcriptional repressor
LARHYQDPAPKRVEDMAVEQHIPPKYLVQILIELKSNHIVKSQRGKEGGYLLARAPSEITLGDVLRSVYGDVFDSPAISDQQCPTELRNAWKKVQQSVTDTANTITFQQLLEDHVEKEKMYYI